MGWITFDDKLVLDFFSQAVGLTWMSVVVRCPDNPDEWGIIELQGTLVSRVGKLDGEQIGSLEIKQVSFSLAFY